MRHGVIVPNFGDYSDPRRLAALARDAEQAGWDGFFLWDHVMAWPTPMVDPWIALAVIAAHTERIRLGPLVTPVPRRRPVELARDVVSLDRLSHGRAVLGVGTGAGPWEWDHLGEEPDPVVRAAMLDEALELLAALQSGDPVRHEGRHYTFRGDRGPGDPTIAATPFLPTPVQRPRVPIWVAGTWPVRAPFRRAAQWDGVVPTARGEGVVNHLTADDVRAVVAFTAAHRPVRRETDQAFDVVVTGHTAGPNAELDRALVRSRAAAGATWWLEDVSPWAFGWQWVGDWPLMAMNDRISAGPVLP